MDLVPSERAVLNMIRALFLESYSRSHKVTVLRSRWPTMHAQAYESGYIGLIAKRLIAVSADKQIFGITSLGMKALAVGQLSPNV
jgi:hypothetical protein